MLSSLVLGFAIVFSIPSPGHIALGTAISDIALGASIGASIGAPIVWGGLAIKDRRIVNQFFKVYQNNPETEFIEFAPHRDDFQNYTPMFLMPTNVEHNNGIIRLLRRIPITNRQLKLYKNKVENELKKIELYNDKVQEAITKKREKIPSDGQRQASLNNIGEFLKKGKPWTAAEKQAQVEKIERYKNYENSDQ
ncbi:MAG: hypothetical protein WA432_03135 [Candidatus Babeliaceae bacterium]